MNDNQVMVMSDTVVRLAKGVILPIDADDRDAARRELHEALEAAFKAGFDLAKLPKYTLLLNDGIHGGAMGPEAPSTDNTFASVDAARDHFRRWLVDSGNDQHRADGYGAASGVLVATERWDGISYGDSAEMVRFTYGERGGVVTEYF